MGIGENYGRTEKIMEERINFDINTILKVGIKSKNVCAKCGSNEKLCIHHITPLSIGGSNEVNNLILLCSFCHKLIHKNKDEIEYYNENEYYSKEQVFKDNNYNLELGWNIDIDCTDHFEFLCPKCKLPAIITNVKLNTYKSLNTPPCFYFLLKCPRCLIKGQRKAYVNYSIEEINKIKKKEENGDTKTD